jgi:hypothetical protein
MVDKKVNAKIVEGQVFATMVACDMYVVSVLVQVYASMIVFGILANCAEGPVDAYMER